MAWVHLIAGNVGSEKRTYAIGLADRLGAAVAAANARRRYTRNVRPEPGGRFLEEQTGQFIARETQQVFPLCWPVIPWSQLELRFQRDWSFQPPQAVESWELEMSQE